jgi:hypothetical protein
MSAIIGSDVPQTGGPANTIGGAPLLRARPDVEGAYVVGALTAISIVYFYAAITRSVVDYFWMDEVLAVTVARQPTLSGVWQAIWSGTDFSPPTYHVLLHGIMKTLGGEHHRLLWRVPSILAVYGAAWCIFLLLAKSRLSRAAATLGFAMVLAFGLFPYAVQVRQYAFLALGLAAALLIWSGIDAARSPKARACGLWLVLSACLGFHFYGIVQVAAIGTAELLYAIGRRRVRVAVWSALLLTVPVEAALYPLASHLAAFNNGDNLAAEYYARPTLDAFVDAEFALVWGGMLALPVLFAALLAIGAAQLRKRFAAPPIRSTPIEPGAGRSELEIVMIALCALPFVAFAISFFVTKSFSGRYMAGAALLPALVIPYLLDCFAWKRTASLAFVPLVMAVLVLDSMLSQPIAASLAVLEKAEPPLPVVVGEGQLYIELMEAAEPSLRRRLVYLTRPAGSVSPDPTNENEVVRLAAALRPEYQVSDPTAFLHAHSSFYVLARPEESTDTTTPSLVARGLLGRRPIYVENGVQLFRSVAPVPVQSNRHIP